jgi:hypothetical protein
MMIKFLSIIVCCYLFILQIPTVMVLAQGYLCEEDQDDVYVIEGVVCGGIFNQVMIIVSSVTFIFYVGFLMVQEIIYTSCNFETDIPWAQLDRKVQLLKVIWKLVITFAFTFDKYGKLRAETGMVCFFIGAIICYKRLTTGLLFHKSVQYAIASYDIIITCFYFLVSLHFFANATINLSNLFLGLFFSLILVALSIFLSEWRARRELDRVSKSNENKFADDPILAERLIYRLFVTIADKDPSAKIKLHTIIS